MASTFDDSVLDFDLNFLRQTANNTAVPSRTQKQRKAILLVKKKTIVTDSVIKQYKAQKASLDQTEKALLASKEECKKICIDYKSVLEKCAQLEQHKQRLETTNKDLEVKSICLENQFEAIQSHTNQLQLLVKENETLIESLKIENQLDKANIKCFEKKVSFLEKKKGTLFDHICAIKDVVLGKKKLSTKIKMILENYKKSSKDEISEDSCSDEEICLDTPDVFDDPMSPLYTEELSEETKRDNLSITEVTTKEDSGTTRFKKDDIDRDSDCSNEVVSVDTGRGSSLEFSDSDKCFHSPDYFINDSPLSAEVVNKDTRKFVDIATSPVTVCRIAHVSTSPIIFEPREIVSTHSKNTTAFDKAIIPKITIDKAVSPIKSILKIDKLATGSSGKIKSCQETATSPIKFNNKTGGNIECYGCGKTVQEKECLELNNSNYLIDDNSNDCEIEMILNTMRLSHELITPLPPTPAKSHTAETSCVSRAPNSLNPPQADNSPFVCHEAAKIREENKILHTNIADLAKEIMSIKNLLLNQVLNNNNNANNRTPDTSQQYSNEDSNINPPSPLPSPQPLPPSGDSNSVSNEMDYCPTEDESDIVQLDDPIVMSTEENVTTEEVNDDDDERDILFIDSENTEILNASQKLQFEEETQVAITEDTFIEDILDVQSKNNHDDVAKKRRKLPARKLTRLQKLKNNLVPKSKIQKVDKPISKRLRYKPKQLPTSAKKTVKISDSSASLNDKDVYEKAVRIMAELKSKDPETDKHGDLINVNLIPVTVDLCDISHCLKTVESADKKRSDTCGQSSTPTRRCSVTTRSHKNVIQNHDNSIDVPLQTDAKERRKSGDTTRNHNKNVKQDNNKSLDLPLQSDAKERRKSGDTTRNHNKNVKQDNNKILDLPLQTDATERRKSGDATRNHNKNVKQDNNKSFDLPLRSDAKERRKSGDTAESRSKIAKQDNKSLDLPLQDVHIRQQGEMAKSGDNNNNVNENNTENRPQRRKSLKRSSIEKPEVQSKRILRSSSIGANIYTPVKENQDTTADSAKEVQMNHLDTALERQTINQNNLETINDRIINYSDLNMFTEETVPEIPGYKKQKSQERKTGIQNTHESILCRMLDKHGITTAKVKTSTSQIPEKSITTVSKKIEDGIAHITGLPPNEVKQAMNKFVDEICSWNVKHFLAGLTKYLKNPERKNELFNKVNTPPAPPMTKSEQVLLYVVIHLKGNWPHVDIINCILNNIEYTLFKLNRTPEFGTIESMSHFYAILCRYIKAKSRLRLFVLDAMYCIQFKSVPLIKQCLDVWMHILPLAHMGIAKSPLVTCLVYLLQFYKCEDRYNRVQDIRNILSRRYSYQITEWSQTKILEMFTNAIMESKDISIEKKMLKIALIILAKRQGPRWCENNIIKNMLQPMIEKEDVPERVKLFCVSLLGPLLKPYPVDMKVHCEIVVNKLVDMLEQNPSKKMEEAIFTSLILMSKHNQNRVIQVLLSWKPKQISPELEDLLKNFVRDKPLKVWKNILSRISLVR